jgi:hypothetical protein
MLILECYTEDVPFSNITRDAKVVHTKIIKKQLPPRPKEEDGKDTISDDLWGLMKHCWSLNPVQRPTMEKVHIFFLGKPRNNDI